MWWIILQFAQENCAIGMFYEKEEQRDPVTAPPISSVVCMAVIMGM